MQTQMLPGCCNAEVVYNFGETINSLFPDKQVEEIELTNQMRFIMKCHKAHMVICTTNTDQKTVNKVLKKLGFKSTPWYAKIVHPATKLKLWWYPPQITP